MRLPSHLFRGLTYIGVAANSDQVARSGRMLVKLESTFIAFNPWKAVLRSDMSIHGYRAIDDDVPIALKGVERWRCSIHSLRYA